jgi:hypothetical protein
LVAFLLLLGLVLPVLAAEDKKPDAKADDKKADVKPDEKKADAKPDEKKPDAKKDLDKPPPPPPAERGTKVGPFNGKVMAVYEAKKSLRIQIQVPTLNQGAVTAYAQAELQYQQAAARRDANGMRNALTNMARQEANLYTMQAKDFELTTTDEVKVRLLHPPVAFDDKGKLKKYTQKELKELKGNDPKLPGYSGEFSDIQTDQVVQVTLLRKKSETPVKPIGKKGKDADMELLKDTELPPISLIVVDNGNPMGK